MELTIAGRHGISAPQPGHDQLRLGDRLRVRIGQRRLDQRRQIKWLPPRGGQALLAVRLQPGQPLPYATDTIEVMYTATVCCIFRA